MLQHTGRFLVKDFLAKNNVTTLEHTPYSPDLAAADFYLFARMKSARKGRRIGDTTDVIKNATEELKSIHKMASRNVSNTFIVAGRSLHLHKGRVLKENSLKDCTVNYLSEIR
jgi:hypothetical protein